MLDPAGAHRGVPALLECYHDLRAEHTAWVQRIHAALFHQGAPPFQGLRQADGPGQLTALAREHLSPAGQAQIAVCLRVLAALEAELTATRHRLLAAAAHLRGAKALTGAIYGAGPITGLALKIGRGGASPVSPRRQARPFAGLG